MTFRQALPARPSVGVSDRVAGHRPTLERLWPAHTSPAKHLPAGVSPNALPARRTGFRRSQPIVPRDRHKLHAAAACCVGNVHASLSTTAHTPMASGRGYSCTPAGPITVPRTVETHCAPCGSWRTPSSTDARDLACCDSSTPPSSARILARAAFRAFVK